MDNIQLYKTSTLLTGQLKWDIVIGANEDILEVQDFHITPISEFVPYNRKSENDLLKRPHQANIKQYFKDTYGSFYSNYTKPQLNSDWPYMEHNKEAQMYDDTYLSGAKRIEHSLYNKQFAYLVPVWLEKLEPDQVLNFDIYILGESKSEGKDVVLGIRTLSFELNDLADKFHNNFVHYFKDYLHYVGIDEGNDNIINIGFDRSQAYISGIELESGNYVTKDISKIVPILLSRERPLLEFDSIITNSFKNNEMICANLINFNICFDIDDILSQSATQFLYGRKVRVKIDVSINTRGISTRVLPKKDLYTNFEEHKAQECGIEYILKEYANGAPVISSNRDHKNNYIDNKTIVIAEDVIDEIRDIHGYMDGPRGNLYGYHTSYDVERNVWDINNNAASLNDKDARYKAAPNIFDYLDDYKCVDLMNKNKVVQNIVHWALYDNPDYIFNIYEGFAGYYGRKRVEHRYGATPDIQKSRYEQSLNNNAWANLMRVSHYEDYQTFIKNHYGIFDKYSSSIGNTWVNGLKYAPTRNGAIKQGRLLLVLFTSQNPTGAKELFDKAVQDSDYNTILVDNKQTGHQVLITFTGFMHSDVIITAWHRDDLVLPNILKSCEEKLKELKDNITKLKDIIGNFFQTGTYTTIDLQTGPIDAYHTSYSADTGVWEILSTVETGTGQIKATNNFYKDHTLNINRDYINAERLYGYFYTLYRFLSSVIPIPLVVLNNSLYKIKAHSPSLSSTEIEYYKRDKCGPIYLLRYDGKIKPCMTDDKLRFNYIYEKLWGENAKWNIAKYSNSRYNPLFPSIDYWSFTKNPINYSEPPLSIAEQKWKAEQDSKVLRREEREIKWYHENTLFVLPELLEFDIIADDNGLGTLNKCIIDYISKIYKQSTIVVPSMKLYNIFYDLISWSKSKFKYHIKMTIK